MTSEAESRVLDSSAKSIVWYECLKSSIANLSAKNAMIHVDTINAYNFIAAERM